MLQIPGPPGTEPLFLHLYFLILCFPVSLFPCFSLPPFLSSLIPLVPYFSVPLFLWSPLPLFPHFPVLLFLCSLIPLFLFLCSPLPLFPYSSGPLLLWSLTPLVPHSSIPLFPYSSILLFLYSLISLLPPHPSSFLRPFLSAAAFFRFPHSSGPPLPLEAVCIPAAVSRRQTPLPARMEAMRASRIRRRIHAFLRPPERSPAQL